MDKQQQVFQQDLTETSHAGAIFVIKLLMKESVAVPEREQMVNVLEKHLSDVDCFWHDEKGAGFAAKKYLAQFQDAAVPPQLMITSCTAFDGQELDEFTKSQMWDCREDRERILAECRYQVIATDLLAAALPARERAEMDMDFLEALVELYPQCEAVYIHHSGKLFLAEQIRQHQIPAEDRFIYFAVNARFFNIQGTEDMLVDTVGMSTLFLPDLQYHFHGFEPNWVVNHAYNIASYLLEQDNPIKDGDTIDGVAEGRIDPDVQWKCSYEMALIQPAREVIDLNMGEYASGHRQEKSAEEEDE